MRELTLGSNDPIKYTFGAEDEPSPYLYIDVNINNEEVHTIPVYEGDKPEILASKFAIEQGLDSEAEKNLRNLIRTQMASVLTKIDEDENEVTENSSEWSYV